MTQHAEQFTGVQILRFVAAMLVVVVHVTQATSIHITGLGDGHYWGAGDFGVDIFFVISGFAMAITTQHLPRLGPGRRTAAWVFMRRRILRIVPLYWFYTLLKIVLALALPALAAKFVLTPGYVAASLFFIPVANEQGLMWPVLPVGWTLNFEMLFYAVFAVAIALGTARIVFCATVFALIFAAAQWWPGIQILHFYGQSIIFEFLLGVCIAHLVTRLGSPKAAFGLLLAVAGFLFALGPSWDDRGSRLVPWELGATLIVLGIVWCESWIAGLKAARPLAFLGDASYSIYLSHAFVVPAGVLALKKLGIHDPAAILLIVGCMVVVVGGLSHVWLEKPMTSFFKHYLFPQASGPNHHATNAPIK
ncbi:MAG: acyltransferase [Ramlibacter sp.]|nr:acyltransferase [Ramlibacter sp.]